MSFISQFLSSVLDDVPMTADERQQYVDHVLSDLLTYRVYEPQENLFYNEGTVGFLLEIPPVIGADVFRTLQTAITSYCPADGTIQFISWASPNLTPALISWSNHRFVQTPLMSRMVERRMAHFNNIRYGADGIVKCVPHRRRILVAGWLDGDPSTNHLKDLKEFRRNLVLALGERRTV
uniref:TraC family protein n=1 Tax=Yoonia rhodophyticola TaxID=3137370 RepID=A0AAN0M662_9RHOB